MIRQKIGTRNYVFTDDLGAWRLNLHVILGEEYNYVVDTGLGSASMEPVAALLKENERPLVVVNTHHHWDHIWGNHVFAGSMILSHQHCLALSEKYWDIMLEENPQYMRGEVKKCLPGITFEKGMYFEKDKVRLFYTPGHTIDGVSVLDEVDRVLNAGDNIGDEPNALLPHIDTDADIYKETIKGYAALDVDTCISGHNQPMGRDVFGKILCLLGK